jgi:hypothetical protein
VVIDAEVVLVQFSVHVLPGIWISPAKAGTERTDTSTNREIKRFTGAPPELND